MQNLNIALLISLNLVKCNDDYYVSGTYFEYIRYLSITSGYKTIYLITSVRNDLNTNRLRNLNVFENIEIVELPYAPNYLSALKDFFLYYKTIKNISLKVDIFYSRVPDPFAWMPGLIFNKRTNVHFVGDMIEAAKRNEKWSWFRKVIMILGYCPEYFLSLFAAKKGRAITNGVHLAERLKKYGIVAEPVISSIVSEESMSNDMLPNLYVHDKLRLIYIGYIRYSKGFTCLMNLWRLLKVNDVNFTFDVIGSGEMLDEVKEFVRNEELENNVIFHGHIDERYTMNKLLQNADLFVFTSLSEGSPRVIIEAMSQGIPVVSTPVGSLPTTFKDYLEIRFADFNDSDGFYKIINEYIENKEAFVSMRERAYLKVKENFTSEAFFRKIFSM